MINKLIRTLTRKQIEAARKKGYADGCLQGWKNCEDHMISLIAIAKREGAKGARLELLDKMRKAEDKAYSDGLRDAGLILNNAHE